MNVFLFQMVGNRGCNRQTPAHTYHLGYNVYLYANWQTGAMYCASGNKYFSQRNMAKVYHDPTNPGYPTTLRLDRKGNVFLMYTDIDRYAIGKIKKSSMRTTIVRCKASVIEGTVCDTDTARSGLMGLLGLNPHERYYPEDAYDSLKNDPLDF